MRIKKRTLKLWLLLIVILAAAYFLFHSRHRTSDVYIFSNNLFSYSEKRPAPVAEVVGTTIPPQAECATGLSPICNDSENYTLSELVIQSRDAKLSAYLLVPKAKQQHERKVGVVLLAGAGVDKNGELGFAKVLANEGFTVLTYDQRSAGRTVVEKATQEPESHKSVYDALASFDYLRESEKIGKVLMAGESLGGRTAIIAASMDNRIYGVLAISTSGYGTVADPYYYSINPDNYFDGIKGRKIAFVHSTSDTVIPIAFAEQTFQRAGEPKKFFKLNGCTHGYCPQMKSQALDALQWVLNSTA